MSPVTLLLMISSTKSLPRLSDENCANSCKFDDLIEKPSDNENGSYDVLYI